MNHARRRFVGTLGAGSLGLLIAGRGREAMAAWGGGELQATTATADLLLNSNENPVGPHPTVIEAVRRELGATGAPAGRYAFGRPRAVAEIIAKRFGVAPDNVLIGCGSTQLLRSCTQVFTSPTRHLVTASPTFEECGRYAATIGHPVRSIPVDGKQRLDLEPMVAAARGAGLVFYCNPNNPTGTVHAPSVTDDFVSRIRRQSPETTILIDEAYIDYVTAPGHRSEIPRAVADPRVIVLRTFSKVYGMAGLRVGYAIAHKDTIRALAAWEDSMAVSSLSMEAAVQAIQLEDRVVAGERTRNTTARDFTRDFFRSRGYVDTDTQANFVFVDVRMPIETFSQACRERGVRIARAFPPLNTYARVTIGTMEDMRRATDVFAQVLAAGRPA